MFISRIEDLPEKTKMCMEAYRNTHGAFPNAAILTGATLDVFKESNMLRNCGRQKRDYSGIALKTGNFQTGVYMFERIPTKYLEDLSPAGSEKARLYKSGGICSLILTTQSSFYRIRKLFGGNRFQNSISCDVGVPIRQLEQQLDREVRAAKTPDRKT